MYLLSPVLTVFHYVLDGEEILNQKDLEWMKKNLRPENICKEATKQPKKGVDRKQKVRIFPSNYRGVVKIKLVNDNVCYV